MKKYKVIGVDNFNRETVSDILIEENLTQEEANNIVSTHNASMRENAPYFYKTVDQDYELFDHTELY